MREDGSHHRYAPYPRLGKRHNGQHVLYSPSTGAMNHTLTTANMIKIKIWVVDITAKYIPASLVAVSRMFDLFIPWCLAMNRFCTRTDTKTTTSEGADRWFNSRSGEIRKSGRVLTKEEREGILKEYSGFAGDSREGCVIRIQRDVRHFPC